MARRESLIAIRVPVIDGFVELKSIFQGSIHSLKVCRGLRRL